MTSPAYLRLVELSKKHGSLTAEQVVADARRKDSPLHPYFEWDNAVAAHAWRLDQARHLIGRFKIIAPDRPDTKVRAFIHIAEDEKFYPADRVMTDDRLQACAIQQAKAELAAFERKYHNLVDVRGLVLDMFATEPV